jgi:hypothetical protein
MSVHCTVEALSTYVDSELPDSERRGLEAHIDECEECRLRLDRLHGVVGQLRRIEEVAAPPTLGWQVQRQVRLESGKVPLRQSFEDRLSRLVRQPLMAPLFAVIVAIGAILYLFSLGVARQTASETRVVIGGVEPSSVTEEPPAPSSGTGADSLESSLTIAGREFLLVEGVWTEVGLEDRLPEERLDLATDGALPPALEELGRRGGRYRLMIDGRVVEIVVSAATDH